MSTTATAPTQAGSRTRLLSWPVIAWGLWDWGSAAFNAVITTFVFTVYLVSDSFGAKADNESALSIGLAIAGLFIALLAPVTGQRSDRGGRTLFWLGGYTAVVVAVSAALFLVRPEPVVGTPRRDRLRAVQTPQGFSTPVLVAAHRAGAERAGDEALAASDDAGLVEACGGSVVVVAGDERAMKVTTPMDLALAELLLERQTAQGERPAGGCGEN